MHGGNARRSEKKKTDLLRDSKKGFQFFQNKAHTVSSARDGQSSYRERVVWDN